MANSITVTESEIKVNGYKIPSIDLSDVTYDYLYYEPDGGNLYKLVKVEGTNYNKIDLTDAEKTACKNYCDSFDETPHKAIVKAAEDAEAALEQVTVVDANKKWVGLVYKNAIPSGHTQLPDGTVLPLPPTPAEHFAETSYTWNGSKFVLDSLSDRKRLAHLNATSITDQLDALLKGIEALAAGESLPSDTTAVINAWKAVKSGTS